MARILVVDDQPELAELIQAVLEGDGHAVEAVHGGQAALERLGQAIYDLVVCDLQMPDIDGAAVYRAVEQLAPPQPAVLLMTGYADTSRSWLSWTSGARATSVNCRSQLARVRAVGIRASPQKRAISGSWAR